MTSTLFGNAARTAALAWMVGLAAPAMATPLMEMRIDDLLPLAQEFRKTMTLTANQQTLWSQVESKTRAIIHERQSRRERLQTKTRQGLDAPAVELRDLVGAFDAEAAATAAEEGKLRELWLTLNDALDETQRRLVANLLIEQMQRVPESGMQRAPVRGKEEGQRSRSGHRQGGPGGPGG